MLCIDNRHTDVYFNIAAEEYLLKNSQENIFMLYRNEPSVIIGKHQDVEAEINTSFVKRNYIKIVRRYSGGGAVFQDMGNINLTFIENNYNLDFDKFRDIMIEMLSSLGIYAEADDRRALTVNGYKISGSAQCIYKDRAMYHATLLFSSDLMDLTTSLNGNPFVSPQVKPNRLRVRSVKSPVANIIDHIESKIDIIGFRNFIMDYFLKKDPNNVLYKFSEKDIIEISNLRNYKYSTQEWNYNASLPYNKYNSRANLLQTKL